MFSLDKDAIELSVLLISQIVIFAIAFQSLRERVKVLELELSKLVTFSTTIHKVETKIDLIYEIFSEKFKKSGL